MHQMVRPLRRIAAACSACSRDTRNTIRLASNARSIRNAANVQLRRSSGSIRTFSQWRTSTSSVRAARPSQSIVSKRAYSEEPTRPKPKKLERSQALPLVLALILAGILGNYTVTLLIASQQKCTDPSISELSHQLDVSTRYDDTADRFDTEVGFSEWLMGLLNIRKELAGKCKGHVLEVSCGTGRNLGYFNILNDGDVESLTFIDLSPQMIEVCKKKWTALYSGREAELRQGLTVRFMTGSAADRMPLAPAADPTTPKKYDAIIQTMGLCSTPAPVALLANLARHLDTANPEARIFLLEHGRSYRDWLNNILDGSARKHAEIHGCWFNREIGALVAEAAAQCDLEVVREKRHHIGTTWVFELKPRKVAGVDDVVVEDRPTAEATRS